MRGPRRVESELGVTFHPDAEPMVRVCDVVACVTGDATGGSDEAERFKERTS